MQGPTSLSNIFICDPGSFSELCPPPLFEDRSSSVGGGGIKPVTQPALSACLHLKDLVPSALLPLYFSKFFHLWVNSTHV